MTSKNKSDTAFPISGRVPPDSFKGMSMRDYFAGQVIPELIRLKGAATEDVEGCAAKSFEIADAMLKRGRVK